MLRVRRVQLKDCDRPSVDFDEFSTELHDYEFDEIWSLLTVMANELATDHYRFNVKHGAFAARSEHD